MNLIQELKLKYENNKSSYSSLDPNYISGLFDAEGCFQIVISAKKSLHLIVSLKLVTRDYPIIFRINEYFKNSGNFTGYNNNKYNYIQINFSSKETIRNLIIPHFDNFPLYTKKMADYLLFREALLLLDTKIYKYSDQFYKFVSLAQASNIGVKSRLTNLFPNVVPASRPIYNIPINLNPWWVTGFTDGDGSFNTSHIYRKSSKGIPEVPTSTKLRFDINQHIVDINLLEKFINFFNCGSVNKRNHMGVYTVQSVVDINNHIIPHFNKYLPQTSKLNSYLIWRELGLLLSKITIKNADDINKSLIISLVDKLQSENKNKVFK